MAAGLLPSTLRETLDLDGQWSFDLDPQDAGGKERWYDRDLPQRIAVPGSWEEQGFGERAPEFIGGWTKRRSYEGKAWYSRVVDVPSSWAGKRVWLQLDRVGWQSSVWVNGVRIGSEDSLSAPHRYDLTPAVRPGESNRIAILVDNAPEGILNYEGHIHSRHTATRWGGITGSARLVATPEAWIEQVAVYPDAGTGQVRLAVRLAGVGDPGLVTVRVLAGATPVAEATAAANGLRELTFDLALGTEARRWSDRDPFLHDIVAELHAESGELVDSVHDRFGLRTFAAHGRSLTLNGEPVFLRGYVDCCIFPLTGYPPSDKSVYERQFAKAREFGFNHVRLHSWTPPREFFEAADEAGMLVQTELPNWSNANSESYLAGAGDFLRAELDRVLADLQRHPSLVIVAMGNELLQPPPGGTPFRYSPYLNELVRHARETDATRLYLDQSGHGYVPEESERETDAFVLHTFRGSTPDTTATWQDKIAGGKTPVIAHEHTQMDMYARFSEIEKFTGVLEPSWLLQARDGLASKGMLEDADRNLAASGALQARCLKELFERLRRTPGLSGVQMLNFTDFPGQGTALNGVLDVFWDEKGNISAEEFRQFNASTVLLCSTQRRTFATGAYLEAELAVSTYVPVSGVVNWRLTDAGDGELASGSAGVSHVSVGHPWPVAALSVQLSRPGKVTLHVEIDGVAYNSWDFWVFDDRRWQDVPRPVRVRPTVQWLSDYYPGLVADEYSFLRGSTEADPSQQVLVSDRLHVRYVDAVLNGATLLWLAEDEALADSVKSNFEPLFWSFLWFPEQPNQTMGLVVEDHPLLSTFPHDGTSDWQWYHLVEGATAVGLDALPALRPIVGGVDNWNRGKRLAYLLEARVGRGRVLMTTLKVLEHFHSQPEAAHLLDAMLRYVHSEAFAPKTDISLAQLWSIVDKPVGYSRP